MNYQTQTMWQAMTISWSLKSAYDTNHVLYTATGTYDISAIVWSLAQMPGCLILMPQMVAAMVLIQSPWALAMIRWSCALILIVIHQVHGAWMMAAM